MPIDLRKLTNSSLDGTEKAPKEVDPAAARLQVRGVERKWREVLSRGLHDEGPARRKRKALGFIDPGRGHGGLRSGIVIEVFEETRFRCRCVKQERYGKKNGN